MQWYSLVPKSSFLLVVYLNLALTVHSLTKSVCSSYLVATDIDIRTHHQYVQPCPVSYPCQCLCDMENRRLWIDCFSRHLPTFPIFEYIDTDQAILEWNIDLAFNSFDNVTIAKWLPENMRIRYLIFSGSLAYDLIVQLNLTHRHLIDQWPNKKHLFITNNGGDEDEEEEEEEEDDDVEELMKRSISHSDYEYTRLLTELTSELRDRSKQIQTFALSLAEEPSPISILYLDHNRLGEIPTRALYNATGLYELYLSYNNISSLPAYAFGFSHRLTRLDLSYNQISSIDNFTFERHPRAYAGPFLIDYLDLSHNQLTVLNPHCFSYLVNLRLLKLQHNQIYELSADVWTGLYRLKYLDLSHNYIDNITQIFYNAYLNELNQLKLTSNNISQINSCEFLALQALNRLDLSNNYLSNLDTCAFYGLPRVTSRSSLNVYLHANQFETLHPCTFNNFARSTIHIENNPLICNCTLNYLLQDRKSLAYTGQECRGGYAYQLQTQFSSPAIRKANRRAGKKFANTSITCRDAYKYYNNLCPQSDCKSLCSPNEQFVIQVSKIALPNRTTSTYRRTFLPLLFFVFYVILTEQVRVVV
ncbi:unnamed protein product [Adineta ricciae]|uniref:Uncharacterized protein n=1 Tax=Adineta ricciae TaxID=249248 RepID=A0A814HC85_ADIRI|nr:unnamed protein product [Adineta ricciae]